MGQRDQDGQEGRPRVGSSGADGDAVETRQSELIDLVINSQDAERRRLARELHDEPVQALAWVTLRLQRLAENAADTDKAEFRELQDFVEATAEGLRRIAYGLHPSLLEDLGLHAALEWHVDDFSKANEVDVDLHITGLNQDARLRRSVEVMLYRVVQEALANVAQHSGAEHASVVIDRRGPELRLIIEDDGCGIELDGSQQPTPTSMRRKLGLTSIRERVALLSGVVAIESRPEGGTTLYVKIPIDGTSP